MSAPTLLVDPNVVLETPDGPQLRGACCRSCGTTTFPAQRRCPRCSATEMRDVALSTDGTLWAFTVQHFEPKPPFRAQGEFEPYGVGYVDLGPVIVETRLTVADTSLLRIGQPMTLTLVPAYREEQSTVFTYAFAPRAGATK